MEFTLLAAALTGVAALWVVLRLTGSPAAFDTAVTSAVVGMFVGRVTQMVAVGVSPLAHPLDVLAVRGGVNTVGATVGAVGYLLWAGRREPRLGARLAPAAAAGLAGWHAGCLWRGMCLGTATHVPWGWSLDGSDVIRHPVELYTASLLIAVSVLLGRAGPRTRAGLALACIAAARLVTEPLRPGLGTGRIWWYAAGVASGLAWVAIGIPGRSAHRTFDRTRQ